MPGKGPSFRCICRVHHCINLEVIGRQSHMGLPVFGIGDTKNHSFVIIRFCDCFVIFV